MNIILQGIVGSTAYGLDHEGSDIDQFGIFCEKFENLVGLDDFPDAFRTEKPDLRLDEARKFCRLAVKCNPSVLELLWLPSYEIMTPQGQALIDIRQAFLSEQRVRKAYLGYASDQFNKLVRRGDGSFSSDLRKRTAKHARHIARLLHQGFDLYLNGNIQVRLADASWYHTFGEEVASGNVRVAFELMENYENAFDSNTSPLPKYANYTVINEWLVATRKAFL